MGTGCPPPPGDASGQGAVSLPRFFFYFWFKMGHFCSFFCVQAKGEGRHRVPLNTPLMTSLWVALSMEQSSSKENVLRVLLLHRFRRSMDAGIR